MRQQNNIAKTVCSIIISLFLFEYSFAQSDREILVQDEPARVFSRGVVDSGVLYPCVAFFAFHTEKKQLFAIHLSNYEESHLRRNFFDILKNNLGWRPASVELYIAGGSPVSLSAKPGFAKEVAETSRSINLHNAAYKERIESLVRELGFTKTHIRWMPDQSLSKVIFDIDISYAHLIVKDADTFKDIFDGRFLDRPVAAGGQCQAAAFRSTAP